MSINRVVVVGGGLAALRSAEALRARGYDGTLTLLTDEPVGPYDRPPLSKAVLTGATAAQATVLRAGDFYAHNGIDVQTDCEAVGLDVAGHRVHTAQGSIAFDALIIATGSRARALPNTERLGGVHTLRTLADASAVRAALLQRPRVVVIGAGFIGAEVASSARSLGLQTTVIEAAATPLARAVGEQMGARLADLHTRNGTDLHCGAGVARLHGTDRIECVELTDGRRIPADLVVVGVGVVPNTGWLADSGLRISNGVQCDATLCAGPERIYAAGDVACWPNPLFGDVMRCEQWTNAAEQGRHVARNILADPAQAIEFGGSNYFWSDQYGVRIQYAGITAADEVHVVAGSVPEGKLLALYRRGERLVGALGLDNAKALLRAKLLIERGARWDDALPALGDHVVPVAL